MTYKPVDRSFDENYLKEQHEAMRWLATQGFTPEEIREFGWGRVDMVKKTIKIEREITRIRYDIETGAVLRENIIHEFQIPLRGTEYEHFFLKSTIWAHSWAFLRERPRTWRKEGSKASLYSLSEVRQICEEFLLDAELESRAETLTNVLKFDTIDLSKLNITKTRSQGQEIEAEAIKT